MVFPRPLIILASMIAAALIVAGCAGASETVSPTVPVGLEPLPGFGAATLVVDGEHKWPVMLADTAAQRSQGLMNVTDLGDWAGMAFVFSQPTESSFWMKDTLIPLTVMWVGAGGAIVGEADMVPCPPGESCVSYPPGAAYLWALEVTVGGAANLGISAGSTLVLTTGAP